MMPTINDLMAPDKQKILLFIVPTIAPVAGLTMNLSRGFSTLGVVFIVVCGLAALYFLPQFLELF